MTSLGPTQRPWSALLVLAMSLGSCGENQPQPNDGPSAPLGSSSIPYDGMSRDDVLAMDAGEWTRAMAKQFERLARAFEAVQDQASAEVALQRVEHLAGNVEQLLTLRRGNMAPPSPEEAKRFEAQMKFYLKRLGAADQALGEKSPELQQALRPKQQEILAMIERLGARAEESR